MKRATFAALLFAGLTSLASVAADEPLRLLGRTYVPNFEGDFDHFGVDVKGNRLFLAGEDKGTLEVFDLKTGRHVKTVKGLDTPHAIHYLSGKDRIIVTDSGDGMSKVLDGKTYAIVDTIKLAAPFFGGFVARDPVPETVELEWFEQTDPATPYRAHTLSDGTLRFICMTTLLLQPMHLLPDTILIDEPELGLHPFAINLLADMMKDVSQYKQLIVSTQSVELLNALEPEHVVVAQRVSGATTLERLDIEELRGWLQDYQTLGELWKRNVLGGRPSL